jgi:hypothetical protein
MTAGAVDDVEHGAGGVGDLHVRGAFGTVYVAVSIG